MNYCAIQTGGVKSQEEMRSSFSAAFMPDHRLHRRGEAVVCPKPRRGGWHLSYPIEKSDSKAGSEILDIILAKDGPSSEIFGTNTAAQVASSPPFFSGSPPSRVSNPLIQDARFCGLPSASSPAPSSGGAGSPLSPTPRKGGCVRASFGSKPSVRVEGFDCLDRDHSRNCRIPALA